MDTKQKSEQNGCRVLTPATILQIDGKLAEAVQMRFAEVTLVVENGKLRFIRGPSPSEPVRN